MPYWAIFFDLDKADGRRVCFVPVGAANATVSDAAEVAYELGCNPGGACGGSPLRPGYIPTAGVVGRLLSEEEAEAALADMSRRA